MTLNLELFGAGCGLVMLAWCAGLAVSYLFSINSSISRTPLDGGR